MAEPFEVGASLTFSGRTFSLEELQLIEQISADFSVLGRTEISRTVCELLDWRRASGRLKNHECRLLLERVERVGWLRLPAVRRLGGRGPRRIELSSPAEPQAEWMGTAGGFEPLKLGGGAGEG